MRPLPTRHLFGQDFVSVGTIDDVVERLLTEGRAGRGAWRCVVTPNVDNVVRYHRFPVDAALARTAFMVLPDGMPIVWASRLLRQPLGGRLPGSDLFARLWPRLAAEGIPTVVVAPSERVADLLADEHPAVRCVVPPMIDMDDAAAVDGLLDDLDGAIEDRDARVVFVAISGTKHHALAWRWRARRELDGRPSPVILLVGASPEFHLGLVKRAPVWMQRLGIEWLHRLLSDPRRLARRYLVEDMLFVRLVWDEWRARRRASRPGGG